MGFSNLVALFIVITTAATLHAHGHTDIQTSAQAAEALRPIAGNFAFFDLRPRHHRHRAAGLAGAWRVLRLTPLGEALRWPVGLAKRPYRAKAFYGTIAAATVVGALLNFTSIDPIKALFWSAVVNGVVAVPVMVAMMVLASRRAVMGQFVLGVPLKVLGWLATLVMLLAAIGMFATWGG